MIKFKVLLIDLMIISSALFSTKTKAQEKISDDYDRSSISIVYVSRGDIYDSQIKEYIRKYFMNTNWETKFDINVIPTTEIKTKAQRDVEISPSTISGKPIFKGIGKEILSYWFNRQNNGMMSNKITDKRAFVEFHDIDFAMEEILFDPQTSGGLLFSLAKDEAQDFLSELKAKGIDAFAVGEIIEKAEKEIYVEEK